MERQIPAQWVIPHGIEVIGADGQKIGTVGQVEDGYIIVERGWLFPIGYPVPMDTVATVDGNRITLTITKDQALSRTWDRESD